MFYNYYSLEEAIHAPIDSNSPFILANERLTRSGHVGRYYTVFPSFKDFLKSRNKYPHCHEILANHIQSEPDLAGRLVFDFDIKLDPGEYDSKKIVVPKNFKQQIEDTIIEVVEQYFNHVDTQKFRFIWSTSQNPSKFSKHLTVKNLYFDNWINMSKIFYRLFSIIWDEKYFWIESKKLLDEQIIRQNASLRMVGSSKIGGYPLVFDDQSSSLTDSLIRIYLKKHRRLEQLVTKNNVISAVYESVLHEPSVETSKENVVGIKPIKSERPIYNEEIYNKAYYLYNCINPNVFKLGKIKSKFVTLIRIKPHKCLISEKFHEKENAFLVVEKNDNSYLVRFGCYRFCSDFRTIYIGSIDAHSLQSVISPRFKPTEKMAIFTHSFFR
ncbi:MAG: hypothetical protein QXW79_00350 [Thermoplasmata archaeon]